MTSLHADNSTRSERSAFCIRRKNLFRVVQCGIFFSSRNCVNSDETCRISTNSRYFSLYRFMVHKSVNSCHCVKSLREYFDECLRTFFLTTPKQACANFKGLLGLFTVDPSCCVVLNPTWLGSILINLGRDFYRALKFTFRRVPSSAS